MPSSEPIFWPVERLLKAFRSRELSPVELAEQTIARIEAFDPQLRSYLSVSPELALEQARTAERIYGEEGEPKQQLLGLPISIKDLFDVEGQPTSLGSLLYRDNIAKEDSAPVERLRAAGAVFLGKSNTAEFGQSATTENLMGDGCANPWAPERTAGGSSGGAASSVGAGLASVGLGSDGGGSIRIPAAMCGLFGLKFTFDPNAVEGAFRAMTQFVCPGPLARSVADARMMSAVLLGREMKVSEPSGLRIAWCEAPEGKPVDKGVRTATRAAVGMLAEMGHRVEEVPIPTEGWLEAFGPMVLADEWRHRGHLLESAEGLTKYTRRAIETAESVTDQEVQNAKVMKKEFEDRIESWFEHYDLVVTPTTATVAFPIGERPRQIEQQEVGPLWGPFPFTAAFNVSGSPAATLPVGLSNGMPVGLQVVGPSGGEAGILNLCEQLEGAIEFPGEMMAERWRSGSATVPPSFEADSAESPDGLRVEYQDSVALIRFERPAKRNALTLPMLAELRRALGEVTERQARAVVITGDSSCFSAGMDLQELAGDASDLRLDDEIAATTEAIRRTPIPVIAAIEGPCYGAAVDLAIACDIRIAGRTASFRVPAVSLGLLYRPDAVADMVAEIGRPETIFRLIVLGERIGAEDAVAAGLAARGTEPGEALEAALAMARKTSEASPGAVSASKGLIKEIVGQRRLDLDEWESLRLELLSSEARGKAVETAKQRFGAIVKAGGDDQ